MEGTDGWKIKKRLEMEEAKRIRNNESRRRKTLSKVGAGTGTIMAGDLNRRDGFLSEIEGPLYFSKRKKGTYADQNITENVSQGTVLEQVDGSDCDLLSESHNRTSRLRSTILESHLKDFEEEMQASGCVSDDTVYMEKNTEPRQGKKWSSRQQELDEDFSEKTEVFFNSFIGKYSIPMNSFCAECERPVISCVIKCSTCKELLCGNCDFQCHFKRPFHIRELFNNEEISSRSLLPEEFVGVNGIVQAKAVPVPLFVPAQCSNCNEYGTFSREAGSRPLAIITKDGRFDLHSTTFRCRKCKNQIDASNETFISSGYFPSTAKKTTCYFAEDLSIHWHHFQHLSPSTSVRKYVESLEEVTKERGGYGTINRTHFSRVGKQFEFFRHKISTTVLSCRILYCEACGEYILAVHVDGNFKLYRWINSSQYHSPSLFGNDVFQWCEDRRNHENEINSVKPVAKKKDTCGTSTYAAGRAESSKKKNIDITGVLMGSCRHGVILGATDLEKGESYRAVHFLLTKMPAKFICQDVICHFWKFADDVGSHIKKYEGMTANSTPFLSRWHGKTHAWYCQTLWLGHWKEKSAATLGEEQEQGFAYFSSLALKTKRMDRGSRRDSMSSSVLYFNAKKNRRMAATLSKRLKKAWKLSPSLRTKLDEMLKERNIKEDQLPSILQKLQEKAINHQDSLSTSNLPLDYERNHLEGLHMALQRFKKRIESEAVTAKERTKIRGHLRKVREDAQNCITSINTALPLILSECKKREEKQEPKEGDDEIKKWKLITMEDFSDGIFPWQSLGGTIKNDFELIDLWMLWQRYEEEITETEKEMHQYIHYLTTRKDDVHKEILEREASLAQSENILVERGKLFLLKREHKKINDRRLFTFKTFSSLIENIENCDDDENDESSDDDIDESEMSDADD